MAQQSGLLNSAVGRTISVLAGGTLFALGAFFFSSTSGMGLLGLGVAGMVMGIFTRPLGFILRHLVGGRGGQQPAAPAGRARQGDDSLYELNFVRESLRRDRENN